MDTSKQRTARGLGRFFTVVVAIPAVGLAVYRPQSSIYWGPLLFAVWHILREVSLINLALVPGRVDASPNPLRTACVRLLVGAMYIGLFALVGAAVGKSFNESYFIVASAVTALGLTTVQNLRHGMVRIVPESLGRPNDYGSTNYDVTSAEEYEEVEYFRFRRKRRR